MDRVYLDICCLKRPFDDQTQRRVAIETAAVLGLLTAADGGHVHLVRSAAHDLENAFNTNARRRLAVTKWLSEALPAPESTPDLASVFANMRAGGIGRFDALHLAWATILEADAFLTTDDRLISHAGRLTCDRPRRIINPVRYMAEFTP